MTILLIVLLYILSVVGSFLLFVDTWRSEPTPLDVKIGDFILFVIVALMPILGMIIAILIFLEYRINLSNFIIFKKKEGK